MNDLSITVYHGLLIGLPHCWDGVKFVLPVFKLDLSCGREPLASSLVRQNVSFYLKKNEKLTQKTGSSTVNGQRSICL